MADDEEEKEYRWETGYEKTWYYLFIKIFSMYMIPMSL